MMRLGWHGVAVGMLLSASVFAQQPMLADQQAEVMLTAARKGYAEGNLPFARERFQDVVTKFGNTPQANAARFGLALCLINSPEQDFAKAIDNLKGPSGDGGFVDRGQALYLLGVSHRALGLNTANPQAANQRFAQAQQAFNTARDVYQGQKNDDWAARCRCDVAEMELRQNKVKEARATCEPFTKDAAFAKNKHRKLGLYYHGLACFLDKDYANAGRSLNQVSPFTDPAFGIHAEYLVGRVMHLGGEQAEAAVHYDAVLANYTRARKDAPEALKQPDRFKNNPFEKARLESLTKTPSPEYVAGAAFHGACLNYEAGKFPEALAKFQTFLKDSSQSPLAPDATLRAGFCLVQLKQFDEATKLLAPIPDKTPRLADQALFWLGKAQLGLATLADPANTTDRDNKLKAAIATLKSATDKANQLTGQEPEAKIRRHEMLFELADAQQSVKQFKEAAGIYETLWNDQSLPNRREELLQRLGAALGAAGQVDRSGQRCDEFRRLFPQSTLTPAVLFRQAENIFAQAVAITKDKNRAAELKQRYEEAATKYKEVVDKYPEFERVHYARYGMGICYTQLGNLEEAVKSFDAIPAPDRTGELASSSYLLADCLIRQAPTKADDALQENQIREKLTLAVGLLESFVAANAKAPEAPASLLKLGHCLKRLGATLADQNERNQTLTKAREAFEKLNKDYTKDPLAGQAILEIAKVRALYGDRGGAMNDLRAFSQREELKNHPIAPLAALYLATLHREQNQPVEAVKVLEEARNRYDADLAKDPERLEWATLLKYHHAVSIFETGKPTDARPLFEQIVQQAPGKPITAEAVLRSGQCRIAEGRKGIEVGQQAVNQAGNDNAKKNAALQTIGQGRQMIVEAADQLYLRAEQFKTALPTAEARARMYYDSAWAWRTIADGEVAKARDQPSHELRPNEKRAHIAYKRLIEEFSDTAMSVDARYELGELLAERGDHDGAIVLLKEALDQEPADRPVTPDTTERIRLRLGASLVAKKDYTAAANQFEAIATNAKSPYIAQALYRAGDCYYAAGDFPKAISKLTVFRDKGEFHNRDNVSDRAMLRLGQSLSETKQSEPARQVFDVMIQRFGAGNPFALDARYGIAGTLQNQGKFDDAVIAYQAVIAATQTEIAAKAQLQIGHCRHAQKRFAEAATAYQLVPYTYEAFPELGYAAMLEAARAFTDDRKPDQAETLLRKLLIVAPANSVWAKAATERLEKK